jgi:hypothetical protein
LEQPDIFEERVTIITNAIQQLRHCRLAVDLLCPEQMEIMQNAVTKIAHDGRFSYLGRKIIQLLSD